MDKLTIKVSERLVSGVVIISAMLYGVSLICSHTLYSGLYYECAEPLINDVQMLVLSFVPLWNARRLKACAFTKIAAISLVLMCAIEIISDLSIYNYELTVSFNMAVWAISTGLIVLLYLFRLCLKKFGIM